MRAEKLTRFIGIASSLVVAVAVLAPLASAATNLKRWKRAIVRTERLPISSSTARDYKTGLQRAGAAAVQCGYLDRRKAFGCQFIVNGKAGLGFITRQTKCRYTSFGVSRNRIIKKAGFNEC